MLRQRLDSIQFSWVSNGERWDQAETAVPRSVEVRHAGARPMDLEPPNGGGTERPDAGNGRQPARTLLQTLTDRTFTSECDNAYIVDSPGLLMVLS